LCKILKEIFNKNRPVVDGLDPVNGQIDRQTDGHDEPDFRNFLHSPESDTVLTVSG